MTRTTFTLLPVGDVVGETIFTPPLDRAPPPITIDDAGPTLTVG